MGNIENIFNIEIKIEEIVEENVENLEGNFLDVTLIYFGEGLFLLRIFEILLDIEIVDIRFFGLEFFEI